MDVTQVEIYLWFLRQYSSYRVIEGLFNVAYQHVGEHLNKVRRAIVDNIYPLVAGFGADHDVTMANFDEEYGTFLSKGISDAFYDEDKILGYMDGTYHSTETFGGINGQKLLFNASNNKRYTRAKARFFIHTQTVNKHEFKTICACVVYELHSAECEDSACICQSRRTRECVSWQCVQR